MYVIYFVYCKVCGLYLYWFYMIREGNFMTVCVARARARVCVCSTVSSLILHRYYNFYFIL